MFKVTTKPKKTVGVNLNFQKTVCSVLTGIIICIVSIVLIISGSKILWEYYFLLKGFPISEIQKITIDYSITIFVGSALFLLLYQPQAKRFLKDLFQVKKDDKALESSCK